MGQPEDFIHNSALGKETLSGDTAEVHTVPPASSRFPKPDTARRPHPAQPPGRKGTGGWRWALGR